jgi:hypothetical protein
VDEAIKLFASGLGTSLPLWATLPAELLTPTMVYLALTDGCRDKRGSFLLETGTGSRWSFAGTGPSACSSSVRPSTYMQTRSVSFAPGPSATPVAIHCTTCKRS